MSRYASLFAALALGACALGPKYHPAPTPPVAAGQFTSSDSIAVSSEALPAKWWHLYDDPALDALVTEALTANTDLRVATANLRRARAVLGETRAQRLPSTGISASATYLKSNGSSGSVGSSGGSSSGGGTACPVLGQPGTSFCPKLFSQNR